MNPDRVESLKNDIDRADRIIRYSVFAAIIVIVITLLVIIMQLVQIQKTIEDNLAISRKNAAENHQRTQEYVKCIATTLLTPIAQRKEIDFENCTNGAIDPNTGAFVPFDNQTKSQQGMSGQVGGSPEVAPPPRLTESPPADQPTTSEPPEQPTPTIIDVVQGGVNSFIDGVESTVDTLKKGIF